MKMWIERVYDKRKIIPVQHVIEPRISLRNFFPYFCIEDNILREHIHVIFSIIYFNVRTNTSEYRNNVKKN